MEMNSGLSFMGMPILAPVRKYTGIFRNKSISTDFGLR